MYQYQWFSPTFAARWPAIAIVSGVGLFVLGVGGWWVFDHLIKGSPIDDTAWIILGATILRLGTIGLAVASIYPFKRLLLRQIVLAGLWGSAAAQIVYPLAETIVKLLVLSGLLDLPATGLGNMTPTGWFNFAAVWLVFGIPGILFVLAAISYRNRLRLTDRLWWLWSLLGIVVLFVIGMLISSL